MTCSSCKYLDESNKKNGALCGSNNCSDKYEKTYSRSTMNVIQYVKMEINSAMMINHYHIIS